MQHHNEGKKQDRFMAISVEMEKKLYNFELAKVITQKESILLRMIRVGTMGAVNSKNQFSSKAAFDLEVLAKDLNLSKKKKIYPYLKRLQCRKLIIREKTNIGGSEILGLDPVFFGQILIDSLHEFEQDKKRRGPAERTRKVQPSRPIRSSRADLFSLQDNEIIHENQPLRILRKEREPERGSVLTRSRAREAKISGEEKSLSSKKLLEWGKVRSKWLAFFPNDEKRLDGCYRQILERGVEVEGHEPWYPRDPISYLAKNYGEIRHLYAHHDVKVYYNPDWEPKNDVH